MYGRGWSSDSLPSLEIIDVGTRPGTTECLLMPVPKRPDVTSRSITQVGTAGSRKGCMSLWTMVPSAQRKQTRTMAAFTD